MLVNFLKQNIMDTITKARALHYVFKIGDRAANSHFFRNILGMQVLRHEEFKEGCEAQCNGPYDNRWSKTMVGYGPESKHFVMELTYNYGVTQYTLGNEFAGITIKSRESLERAKKFNYPIHIEHDMNTLISPDGYRFYIIDMPQPTDTDPVCEVSLMSSNMQNTRNYWHKVLNMQIICDCEQAISLNYGPHQAKLRFQKSKEPIDRAHAYGRIAFSVPYDVQPVIAKKIAEINGTVLKPLITLETPGKATVRVIILADPDDHEICFVDEEGFSELSKVEEEGAKELDKYIKKDPFQNKASIIEAALQSN